jgi:hypothetical protein
MWKENWGPEQTRTTAPAATAKPITEDEMRTILDRLEATGDIFRENWELRNLLSTREAETKELRTRNAEMEELIRKFAPLLVNAGTEMGLAAKHEKPPMKIFT